MTVITMNDIRVLHCTN